MEKIKSLLVLTFAFLLASIGLAQSPTPAELFTQGTQRYMAKDYKEAQKIFSQLLTLEPTNTKVLTNLALTEYQLNNKPFAIGLLRKALAQPSESSTAKQSLDFVLTQSPLKEVPRHLEFYEILRARFLEHIPLTAYLTLSALSFFAAGWTLLTYLGRRRRALEEELAIPSFPFISAILTLFFITFTSFAGLKAYDSSQWRGTVIVEKVSLQTLPGEGQLHILDLYGGMEVVIQEFQGDWVQVTYPGSLTGWIKKSTLLMTR